MNSTDVYSLPVVIPGCFKSVFFYALPTACIEANPQYFDWYNMNYLSFYGYKNTLNQAKYEFRFVDAISYVDRGLHLNEAVSIDRIVLCEFHCDDIIQFFCNYIEKQYYIIAYLDEDSLSESPFHDCVHEYLIYGYDKVSGELLMLGMNSNENYTLLRYSFSDVEAAYKAMLCSDSKGKQLYCMRLDNRFTLTDQCDDRYHAHLISRLYQEEIFVDKIHAFLNGNIIQGKLLIRSATINPVLAGGTDTYAVFEDYLENIRNGNGTWEYNIPFFLEDCTRSIYRRLVYAYKKTGKEIYRRTAEEYAPVLEKAEAFRNRHMLCMMEHVGTTDRLSRMIDELFKAEKKILSGI